MQLLPAFADDVITNVMSPVVSYQFYDALGEATNSAIISPVVSYQYFDWLGHGVLQSLNSLEVSYYWPPNLPGPNVSVHGRVVDFSGQPVIGASVSAFTENALNATAQTDFNGNYTLPPLAPSVYALTASKSPVADSKRVVALSLSSAQQDFILLQITPQLPLQTAVADSTPPVAQALDGALLVFNGTSFVNELSLLDPSKLTVVVTHGMNDSATNDWPADMASALKNKGVWPLVNVVAWNWPNAAKGTLKFIPIAQGNTPPEGIRLGAALYNALGASYQMPLDFIGHSLGALVNRYAIDYVHGHTNGKVAGVAPPWEFGKTHVTLLDEAEDASVFSLSPFDWKSPIPSSYAWIDNYISAFGLYHAEAVTIYLQKAPIGLIAEHNYSYQWYMDSIQNANLFSILGFRESYAYNLFLGDSVSLFPLSYYQPGAKYQQTPSSDNILDLEVIPEFNYTGGNPFANPMANQVITAPQYVVSGAVAPGWNEGQVSLQSSQYSGINVDQGIEFLVNANQSSGSGNLQTLDLVNLPAFQATLQNGPPLNGGNNIRGIHANGNTPGDTVLNSPAYLWLPIFVPSDVKAMAFDFTISGDGNDDSLTFGINDTNLFSLQSRFVADDAMSTSPLIDISTYAGKTNVFFFGIMGGTSTNCTVQIEGVRFYTLAPPQLTITQSGTEILLAWPSSAGGCAVQSTMNLTTPNWETITNMPIISGSNYIVTNSCLNQTMFFRLTQ